jgi:hypothetical protein
MSNILQKVQRDAHSEYEIDVFNLFHLVSFLKHAFQNLVDVNLYT